MKKIAFYFSICCCLSLLASCSDTNKNQQLTAENKSNTSVSKTKSQVIRKGKPVIYQVLPRLFGNKVATNKPWGTIEENGVGKFSDFTDKALLKIKEFGVSHIWYTGVPHHAVIRDYTKYGISNDDPDVVKGRAGSPYAVKDYYNVNPDLADDPAKRLQEFKQLIERTHSHGMKVIIDIVPNHIARNYKSISKPDGVKDFGEDDDVSADYNRDNNFYYIPGKEFQVPESGDGYRPINGEKNLLSDGKFKEYPAKWTGNGSRKAQPDQNDWYETVKVNYGVTPTGEYDFERLPVEYFNKSHSEHYEFWQGKDIPNSWIKFREIALYWLDMGVDGFRYDMAEMVPVEFWSYLNSAIKNRNPDATLIAEVYNPSIYRKYISLGKMDYLYDKVDFYDTTKLIMQGKQSTSALLPIVDKFSDIDSHLLHFLENHDEQRIASSDFAGDAQKGKPAMVVSSLIGKGPTMLYFAQALGEKASGDAGFGDPTRTTIFDYWGIPSLQRWMNEGKFDGEKMFHNERELRKFYQKLLFFSASNPAINGEYQDLHSINLAESGDYTESLFSFVRWNKQHKVIVIANFSDAKSFDINLQIGDQILDKWQIPDGHYEMQDILSTTEQNNSLVVTNGKASIQVSVRPLESKVYHLLVD